MRSDTASDGAPRPRVSASTTRPSTSRRAAWSPPSSPRSASSSAPTWPAWSRHSARVGGCEIQRGERARPAGPACARPARPLRMDRLRRSGSIPGRVRDDGAGAAPGPERSGRERGRRREPARAPPLARADAPGRSRDRLACHRAGQPECRAAPPERPGDRHGLPATDRLVVGGGRQPQPGRAHPLRGVRAGASRGTPPLRGLRQRGPLGGRPGRQRLDPALGRALRRGRRGRRPRSGGPLRPRRAPHAPGREPAALRRRGRDLDAPCRLRALLGAHLGPPARGRPDGAAVRQHGWQQRPAGFHGPRPDVPGPQELALDLARGPLGPAGGAERGSAPVRLPGRERAALPGRWRQLGQRGLPGQWQRRAPDRLRGRRRYDPLHRDAQRGELGPPPLR